MLFRAIQGYLGLLTPGTTILPQLASPWNFLDPSILSFSLSYSLSFYRQQGPVPRYRDRYRSFLGF
jgi:hypothetical protein